MKPVPKEQIKCEVHNLFFFLYKKFKKIQKNNKKYQKIQKIQKTLF